MKFSIELSSADRERFATLLGEVATYAVDAHNALVKENDGIAVMGNLAMLERSYAVIASMAGGFVPVENLPDFDELEQGVFVTSKLSIT